MSQNYQKSHLDKLDHRSQNGKNRLTSDAEAWKVEPIAAEASEEVEQRA